MEDFIRDIPSIDDMPYLKARLGKARSDRVRYAGNADTTHLKCATNIPNSVIAQMQFKRTTDYGCPISDVLQGAANMDAGHSLPLSVNRLYSVLQSIEVVNTREVMTMMAVDKRQAQRYVRAVKFVMPHLNAIIKTDK